MRPTWYWARVLRNAPRRSPAWRVEPLTTFLDFGFPDELKFRSSMTLFAQTAPKPEIFQDAILKYFNGRPDRRTLAILKDFERP